MVLGRTQANFLMLALTHIRQQLERILVRVSTRVSGFPVSRHTFRFLLMFRCSKCGSFHLTGLFKVSTCTFGSFRGLDYQLESILSMGQGLTGRLQV